MTRLWTEKVAALLAWNNYMHAASSAYIPDAWDEPLSCASKRSTILSTGVSFRSDFLAGSVSTQTAGVDLRLRLWPLDLTQFQHRASVKDVGPTLNPRTSRRRACFYGNRLEDTNGSWGILHLIPRSWMCGDTAPAWITPALRRHSLGGLGAVYHA